MSEAIIGVSLMVLGTSLPELSTTVIAALHKNSDIALGNVIGSNLFNILAILGITAMMVDIPVEPRFIQFDLWIMFGVSICLWVMVILKVRIGKIWGAAFLVGYFSYLSAIY